MKDWKIEIKPAKDGGLILRTVADSEDRIAEELTRRIERMLLTPKLKAR